MFNESQALQKIKVYSGKPKEKAVPLENGRISTGHWDLHAAIYILIPQDWTVTLLHVAMNFKPT